MQIVKNTTILYEPLFANCVRGCVATAGCHSLLIYHFFRKDKKNGDRESLRLLYK